MHDDLRERVRVAAGRASVSTAAVIDSQSVKGLEMTGRARRGSDAGKKIYGIRRYLAVDVLGVLLTMLVPAASVQDRDAAPWAFTGRADLMPAGGVRVAWGAGG